MKFFYQTACLLSLWVVSSRSFSASLRTQRTQSMHPLFVNRQTRLEQYKSSNNSWDGDDRRWTRVLKRRIESRIEEGTETPVRDALIVSNIAMYVYQVVNTLRYLIVKYPTYWPSWSMLSDTILESGAAVSPLTRAFMFSSYLGKRQPHRYLSSGFLHGGLLHLACNLYTLQQMPTWLETGLGRPLFVTTYMVGIVAGNFVHARYAMDEFLGCLGASGGIMALAGLTFMALAKMGNKPASSKILKNVGALFVLGAVIPSVSNASHIGGFLSGCVMGLVFSPGYRKSYSLRRKNSYDTDTAPRGFRQVMGFGVVPKDRPPIPLAVLWAVFAFYASTDPKLQGMPQIVWKGLTRPGSL